MKTREEAFAVLKQYNESEALLKHGMAVEAVMREFAARAGEDVEYWGQVGLLHDVDYEKWPEEHLKVAPRLLAEAGYDDAFIHAVCAHGWSICSDAEPTLYMEKVLFAVDELTGLIGAAALMRPTGFEGMEVKSVAKKFKDKKFAAGCSRDVIRKGAELMGMELNELFEKTLAAMQR